ncbi:hypothetical protein EB796_024035 [Bugula neritina]|uniref:Uncharacterized protein n=1 Tax=Bugula neritina TaxID=10212 RepID=A0A7J7IUQ6_BUGNE|nr:hypothetical protein EB796_024035 [Bugula neritina]
MPVNKGASPAGRTASKTHPNLLALFCHAAEEMVGQRVLPATIKKIRPLQHLVQPGDTVSTLQFQLTTRRRETTFTFNTSKEEG